MAAQTAATSNAHGHECGERGNAHGQAAPEWEAVLQEEVVLLEIPGPKEPHSGGDVKTLPPLICTADDS